MPPKSVKQQEAADRYLKEKVDTIALRIPKGKKAVIQAHAKAMGESVNGFINRAIDGQIEHDKEGAEV